MAIRISGLNSGLDTDSIVQELVSAYRTKTEKYEKAQTKLSWKQDSWKEMNNKIYSFYSKTLSNMRMVGNFNKKKTTVSDDSKATVTADSSVTNGTQTLDVVKLAKSGYLTGKKIEAENRDANVSSLMGGRTGTLNFKVGDEVKSVDVTSDMTIGDFVSKLNENGVSARFDAGQQRLFINSAKSGESNDFNFIVNDGDTETYKMLEGLGLATEANYEKAYGVGTAPEKMEFAIKDNASNAVIKLNGATFVGESNTFNINGLNITATGVTDKEMTITTATDVDGIYNMIKGFFKEYNELMNSMESAYNAKSAKGYEPLTDDEKDQMSDTEIEKWETKIKDSLLRRDSTLYSVMSGMSTKMMQGFEVNGKMYNLASFGIKTSSYFTRAENESYAYHIDGDADDAATSSNEDKLRKMIQDDPEAVGSFFTQLANSVYDDLHKRMGSTELSSVYKVYNDKQMQSEYDNYTKTIKKWEEKLKEMEDRYYKQFSAMETALGKLQSQTNSLSSLFGA